MSRDDFEQRVEQAVGDRYRLDGDQDGLPPTRPPWRLFLATERPSGRRVVIKALSAEGLDPMVPKRFEKEVGSVESPPGWLGLPDFGHPRLLSIASRGHREGVLYYVTPWLAGGSLRARLEREPRLSTEDAIRILDGVAEALAFLHERGFVHGRVKPENVLFDQGRVVLADGVSRLFEDSAAHSLDTDGIGYASPEALRGVRLDRPSDVHALGVVGYEMLAGRRPFPGTVPQAAVAMLSGTPTDLTRIRPEVSPTLANVLATALAPAPEDRFPDAARFRAALAGAG